LDSIYNDLYKINSQNKTSLNISDAEIEFELKKSKKVVIENNIEEIQKEIIDLNNDYEKNKNYLISVY
jgi:hypothetical protein